MPDPASTAPRPVDLSLVMTAVEALDVLALDPRLRARIVVPPAVDRDADEAPDLWIETRDLVTGDRIRTWVWSRTTLDRMLAYVDADHAMAARDRARLATMGAGRN